MSILSNLMKLVQQSFPAAGNATYYGGYDEPSPFKQLLQTGSTPSKPIGSADIRSGDGFALNPATGQYEQAYAKYGIGPGRDPEGQYDHYDYSFDPTGRQSLAGWAPGYYSGNESTFGNFMERAIGGGLLAIGGAAGAGAAGFGPAAAEGTAALAPGIVAGGTAAAEGAGAAIGAGGGEALATTAATVSPVSAGTTLADLSATALPEVGVTGSVGADLLSTAGIAGGAGAISTLAKGADIATGAGSDLDLDNLLQGLDLHDLDLSGVGDALDGLGGEEGGMLDNLMKWAGGGISDLASGIGGGIESLLGKAAGLFSGGAGGLLNVGQGLGTLALGNKILDTTRDAAKMMDPFGGQRPMYMEKLARLMNDPSSITATPGYEAGMEAVNRGMAKGGYLGSGNQMIALQRYGGDFYKNEIDRLMTMSGANINPAEGGKTLVSGTVSAANALAGGMGQIAYGMRG